MIKIILAGLWACLVTLAASYAAVSWQAGQASPEAEPERLYGGLETVRTRMISVPIIRSGAIQGYVMAQFSFTADASILKRLSVKADVVVLDEAFQAIYSEDALDFRDLKKQDLGGLVKRIVEGSNKRFGTRIVEDAFIQELSYVTKDGTRTGSKRGA
ncbi:MAG: hypothetical protein HC868_01670 [Sphingomonadales bacterium]|nr:hypothetical protein [Sphingomonadales bacterium]